MTIDGREIERRANAGDPDALTTLEPRRRHKLQPPPSWMKAGAYADYHSVIGGDITQPHMKLRCDPYQAMSGGIWVAFLEGKSGYVACEALTWPASEPARP